MKTLENFWFSDAFRGCKSGALVEIDYKVMRSLSIKSLGIKNKRLYNSNTASKMKFFLKDFYSKCDQIHGFVRIWSHLLKNP